MVGVVRPLILWFRIKGVGLRFANLLFGLMLTLLLFGPPGFLNSSWFQVDAGCITGSDTAAWPYIVGILIRFTSFLNTLHWPSGFVDLGHFGISFLELLVFWAGQRLLSEKVTRPHVRANRPILIPLFLCQLCSLVRALAKLPGGLSRFCTLPSWFSYVSFKASWLESVFSWPLLQTIGILLSSMLLKVFVGFCCTLQGQLQSFWMALVFLHVLIDFLLLLVIFLFQMVIWEDGSGLPRRHVQVYFLIAIRIQGIQCRGDGKDCATPSSEGVGGEVGEPRNLLPRHGVG